MLQPLGTSRESLSKGLPGSRFKLAQLFPSQKQSSDHLLVFPPWREQPSGTTSPSGHCEIRQGVGAVERRAHPTPGVQWAGRDYISQEAEEGREGAGRGGAPAPPPCSLREVNKPRAGSGRRDSGGGLAAARAAERAPSCNRATQPASPTGPGAVPDCSRQRRLLSVGEVSTEKPRSPPAMPMELVRMINVQRLLEAAEFLERRDRGNG